MPMDDARLLLLVPKLEEVRRNLKNPGRGELRVDAQEMPEFPGCLRQARSVKGRSLWSEVGPALPTYLQWDW
jgi:hypothetical protein